MKLKQEAVTFPSGSLSLEGVWHWPDVPGPWPAVVVCHPYPLYGGDMDNNVVVAICQALSQIALAAFRFNFRGVGKSQGSFGQGVGEQDDLRAALAFLVDESRVKKSMGVAGYSFGSTIAVPVVPREAQVQALALISPPLHSPGLEPLKGFPKPKLILSGSHDFVVSPQELQLAVNALPPPVEIYIVAGADHFWWGYESQVAEKVARFFKDALAEAV